MRKILRTTVYILLSCSMMSSVVNDLNFIMTLLTSNATLLHKVAVLHTAKTYFGNATLGFIDVPVAETIFNFCSFQTWKWSLPNNSWLAFFCSSYHHIFFSNDTFNLSLVVVYSINLACLLSKHFDPVQHL